MFMDPVTPIDVYTATSKIKTKTSKDHDGISTKLVKGSIDNIYIPLTHIINLSLSTYWNCTTEYEGRPGYPNI